MLVAVVVLHRILPQLMKPQRELEHPQSEMKEEPQPEIKQEQQSKVEQTRPEFGEEQQAEWEEDLRPKPKGEEEEEKEAKESKVVVDPSEDAAPPESAQSVSNGIRGNDSAGTGNEEAEEELEDEPLEKVLDTFNKDQLVALLKLAVDKHPDSIDSVHKVADVDPAHRKIFVHGLGCDTTTKTLIAEFGKYGEIEDCKAVTEDQLGGRL